MSFDIDFFCPFCAAQCIEHKTAPGRGHNGTYRAKYTCTKCCFSTPWKLKASLMFNLIRMFPSSVYPK